MTIAKLNKLLKAQIVDSNEFHEQHPETTGVGPDFDEVIREILRSDTVAGTLLGSLSFFMNPTGIISTLADVRKLAQTGDATGKLGTVVDNHKSLFGTSLAMFYWGMQIGRQLEHEEAAVLSQVETASAAVPALDSDVQGVYNGVVALEGFYNAVVALAQEAKANGYAPIHASELLDEARKIDSTL